jgi:mono/diheme cytochrome c family protein
MARSIAAQRSVWFACVLALCAPTGCRRGSAPTAAGSPEARRRALQLFTDRCAGCHGPRGGGDGPAAAALNPRPRNFADPSWHGRATDEHLRAVITRGGAAMGLSPMMPPSPDLATDRPTLDALVEHLRALMARR